MVTDNIDNSLFRASCTRNGGEVHFWVVAMNWSAPLIVPCRVPASERFPMFEQLGKLLLGRGRNDAVGSNWHCLCVTSIVCAGCGDGLASVKGTLMLDGQPLARTKEVEVTILFYPEVRGQCAGGRHGRRVRPLHFVDRRSRSGSRQAIMS